MTRLAVLALLLRWAGPCMLDVVRRGYGWRNAVAWTAASSWALWRLTAGASVARPRMPLDCVRSHGAPPARPATGRKGWGA